MLSTAKGFDFRNFKNVKTAMEHVGLHVGLLVYTAIGAMVSCSIFKYSSMENYHQNQTSWTLFFGSCVLKA